MKKPVFLVLFIVLIVIVCSCGCTGVPPKNPVSQGTQQATMITTTAPAGITTTTLRGRVIIDERVNIQSTANKKYAFEDFGYQYLYPKDSFTISLDSDKPVNVIVIDKADELKFPTVTPAWNTDFGKDQWDYSPIVPVFSQSNVLKKDMTFTIKDKSSYFLIIDPRYGANQEEVHFDLKVIKK
jgi:hypothetical protein